ncbi:MAG: peptidase M28 [Planctomycetaceae bacterium]|nr:peptidase M28 [Planctomycetaceae bacterium]
MVLVPIVMLTLAFNLPTQETLEGDEKTSSTVFNSRRASDYLLKICRIGPRPSGSAGMAEQQKLITKHFTDLGADVRYQPFDVAHPLTGSPVRMTNIVVSWNPEAKERVVLCCHYDTRPFPDRDFYNPRGKFVGANDGASGVALFMELGHRMKQLKPTFGVDFIFFDGEELVYRKGDKYFWGSEYFAKQYRDNPPPYKYHYGILVDMIGDRRLTIFMERNSLRLAPNLTRSVFEAAKKVRVREFIPRAKHEVRDDHLALNEIARIPCCDLIDFDYKYWHTTRDVPSQCSGGSLMKVAKVLMEWLENVPQPIRP